MSDLVINFCTSCKKSTCKYGYCKDLKNYIKSLREQKLLKNKGGKNSKKKVSNIDKQ